MWTKRLSRTDAQRPTRGWPVPYLRFIKGRNPHDNQTWFRQVFFGNEIWRPAIFGEHAVEETYVQFSVTILGVYRGPRSMQITHDYNRQQNNNTPNTWLHYDEDTKNDLNAQDLSGRDIKISKLASGQYKFDII